MDPRFFPSIYGSRTSRLGHKSMEKNSVRNLPYGSKTRLIRGMYPSSKMQDEDTFLGQKGLGKIFIRLNSFGVPEKKKKKKNWLRRCACYPLPVTQ